MHSFGDYVGNVDEYRPTDSYSTQIGKLHNHEIKAQYERTNWQNKVEQMTRISDICMVLEDIDNALRQHLKSNDSAGVNTEGIETLLSGDPYFIGQTDCSEDMILSIALWADCQQCDDAVKLFILQLRWHLLCRFLGSPSHPDFDDNQLGRIQFQKGRMYQHRTLQMNYTTYDVHREQDVVNPSTPHCFVLLPAELEADSDHPYIYAKLSYIECDTDQDITDSFDFIDPKDIIRAAHLIPEFALGTTKEFLQVPSSISHDNSDHTDWNGYYVNRFVDQDMLMRYIGEGIGHIKQKVGQLAASIVDDQGKWYYFTSDENNGMNESKNEESEREESENEGNFDISAGGGDEIGAVEAGDLTTKRLKALSQIQTGLSI
ncbi:hypothetical protein FRC06_007448 [Ceratobasidium sp. 370]|nr:hypothetical protein FRC06_007448 [Ceratobasidium sp. 370]